MLKLVIEDDEGRRTTVPLVRSEVTIGRQDGNTIRLTERNVSRRHARLVRTDDGVLVEDHSRYGTRHNGVPIDGQITFADGDVISIGDYRLHLRADAASPRGPSPEPVEIVDGRESDDTAPIPTADDGATDVMPTVEPLPADQRSRLVCLTSPFAGSEFHIVLADIVVGRSPDCDVVVDHPSVSKHHIRITTRDGQVRLLDLGSSNGVLVNGERTRDQALGAGDVVELGVLRFRYVAPGEAFAFSWDEAIDDIEGDGQRRGLVVPIVAAAVLLAIVAAVLLLRGGESSNTPAPDAADAAFAAPEAGVDPGALLTDAQRHLAAARWDEALAAAEQVPADAAQADTAASLATRAREEMDNRAVYDDVLRLAEAGDNEAAYRRIDDIPRGSWYRTRVTDEDLERRVLSALIDQRVAASVAAEDGGDSAGARAIIVDTVALAPDDPRLTSRLAQLDAADSGTTTPLPVDPPPSREPTPERAPPAREPTPERAPPAIDREAGRTPDESAVTPPTNEPIVDPRQRAGELRRQAMSAGVQGMHQDAIRYLEEALALTPGDASLNLMLYQNYNEVGNRRRAAQALDRYLRQEPDTPRRAEFEAWLRDNDPR